MANNPLENFNKDKLLEGITLTYKNAQEHFLTAQLLKKENHIGFAMSHLIYSSEASATTMMLLNIYLNAPVADDLINQFYSEHKIKGVANKVFNLFYYNISVLKKLVHDFDDGKISKEEFDNKRIAMLFDTFRKKPRSKERQKLYGFWDSAENYRVRGMYVEPNGIGWCTPNAFKMETYNEVTKIVEELLVNMKVMIDMNTSTKYDDFIQEKVNNMSDEDFEKFEEACKKIIAPLDKLAKNYKKKK